MRFVHALVANALYADLGRSLRVRLHGQAARSLEQRTEDIGPDVVVQLARHCARAGWPDAAQRWSTLAGDQALEQLAPTEASHHYRIALDTGDRNASSRRRTRRSARAARRCATPGRRPASTRHRSRKVPTSPAAAARTTCSSGPRSRRTPASCVSIRVHRSISRPSRRRSRSRTTADTATYARLLALLAQSLVWTPDAERRVASAHQALELADAHHDPTLLARIAPGVLWGLWEPGSADVRSRVAAKAVAVAEASGDPRLEFGAHLAAFDIAIESADHVTAARSLAKLRATARTIGEPRLRWTVGLAETFTATMAGRLVEAESAAMQTLELGMQIGAPDAFTFFAAQFFVIGTFAGRHDELFPLVEQATKDDPLAIAFKLAYGIICHAVGRERACTRDPRRRDGERLRGRCPSTTSGRLASSATPSSRSSSITPTPRPSSCPSWSRTRTMSRSTACRVRGRSPPTSGNSSRSSGVMTTRRNTCAPRSTSPTAFGWQYHRATTLFALAQARGRRLGRLDAEARAWLGEASELCRTLGFRTWIPRIDELQAGGIEVADTI